MMGRERLDLPEIIAAPSGALLPTPDIVTERVPKLRPLLMSVVLGAFFASMFKVLLGDIGSIIVIARVITTSIAIIVLLVIAMKYMISAPGDRADIKKHAIAYVIGAMILFGSSAILGILVNIAGKIK